jgi:uncharacterized protein (DUF4415 family)
MKVGASAETKKKGGRAKKERPFFAPDGYEWEDAPADIADSMDRAEPVVDFLPSPEKLMKAETKIVVTIRLDGEVLEWFKSMGKGYQTKINAVLKAYKRANENS